MGFPLRKAVRIGVTNRPQEKAQRSFAELRQALESGYVGVEDEGDWPNGLLRWAFRMGRRQRGKP